MSKPVKEMLRREISARLEGVDSLAIVGFTGVDAGATNDIRGRLREKDIRMTVVKNSVARQAFRQVGLEAAVDLIDGPCALAYGGDSVVDVVRELLDIHKDAPNLTVKGALLEGEPFGPERVEELSEYPTRDEAIGRVVACALSPAGKIAGCLVGPASKIASLVKAVEERQSEGGSSEEAA